MFKASISIGLALLLATTATAQTNPDSARQWAKWRGPSANGLATSSNPPTKWSETENIKWKVEIPGQGLSTPIIWNDVIYLQSAIPTGPVAQKKRAGQRQDRQKERPESQSNKNTLKGEQQREGQRPQGPRGERNRGGRRGGGRGRSIPSEVHQFALIAIDRNTGKTLWQKTLREEIPHEGSHNDGSLAPASPITDGEHVFAYFGSRGLYCLTLDGNLVWEKDLGDMKTRNGFGEGSSPALHGNTLVVNWDHEGDSFIVALDKNTGKEKWRNPRSEVTSWSTPLILEDGGKPQVVVSATNRIRSYDLETGKTIWECGGLGVNCAPTPVTSSGLLFAMSGYRDPNMLAIKYQGAKGDITGSDAIAWSTTKGTSYVPSALAYDDNLYYLKKSSNMLSCVDAKTGKTHYAQERLEDISGVYASPVAAANRVYVAGRNGATYVLRHGPSFEVLAINKLDDEFSASPAIVGRDLYLRGRKNLYRIGAN